MLPLILPMPAYVSYPSPSPLFSRPPLLPPSPSTPPPSTHPPPQVNVAIEQLLEVESQRNEGYATLQTPAVGMARLGQPTQRIVYGTLEQLLKVDFGPPLHCLALCGETHPLELEVLAHYQVKEEDMTYEGPPKEAARSEDVDSEDDQA